ncbi:TlpA disulfide reductase family protein [Sedimentisphaera salicampi]|uniref:Thiol-disulfide oxidoreductase ResA n=1 Tax=Sedimentisphaera salicampi TaxID=1941349 RepID=A0A1W6LL41_9BACT|nr:TlpA disulfide reductase family protein [Sedimentisphaera salicampi]ARN56491.1 Thiol-disulfide oxidoreductase ResA [Sedimentisphaera salicampi]OXU15374.1 Thiol-disulfide oxidoreductase ResA [Sedimentisphaera salicampi]
MDENKNLEDQNSENQQNGQEQGHEGQSKVHKFWPLALIVIIAGAAILIQKTPCCGIAGQSGQAGGNAEGIKQAEVSSSLTGIIPASRLAMESFYGADASEMSVENLEGEKIELAEMEDKNVLVVFWATWCPPCREEIPELKKLRNKYSSDELEIIAISFENEKTVKDFAQEKGINYTVAASSQNELPSPFKDIRAYPTIMFIDKEGKFKAVVEGGIGLDTMEKVISL